MCKLQTYLPILFPSSQLICVLGCSFSFDTFAAQSPCFWFWLLRDQLPMALSSPGSKWLLCLCSSPPSSLPCPPSAQLIVTSPPPPIASITNQIEVKRGWLLHSPDPISHHMLCRSTSSPTIIAHRPRLWFVHWGCFVGPSIKSTASVATEAEKGFWVVLGGSGGHHPMIRRPSDMVSMIVLCIKITLMSRWGRCEWADTSYGYIKLFKLWTYFCGAEKILSKPFSCRLCTELFRNPQGSPDSCIDFVLFFAQ
jgi:hypothetical protein